MTGKRILELDIPAPCEWLTSNMRLNRWEESRRKKAWRNAGWAASVGHEPFTGPVLIVAHIWKTRSGVWDPNNWHDTTKPIVDGLVDSGLLSADDHEHVIGPDHRRGGKGEPRIILTIEEAR